MMVGMEKAEGLGPDVLGDGRQNVQVTGTLPISMTAFVGRDQELHAARLFDRVYLMAPVLRPTSQRLSRHSSMPPRRLGLSM
jgi:hypothetical protein